MRGELYCRNGDHMWTRPEGARGRGPHHCPEHATPRQPSPAIAVVMCQLGGHNWEVPRTTGWQLKKNCPEHQPKPSERQRAPKSSGDVVVVPPKKSGPPETIQTSEGVYMWWSNKDIAYIKRKFKDDTSDVGMRIRNELC